MSSSLTQPVAARILLGLAVSVAAYSVEPGVILASLAPPQIPSDGAARSLSHGATEEKVTPCLLKIIVRVYSYAHVPRRILMQAERHASHVFRKVEIETVWLDCSPRTLETEMNPACNKPLSPIDLVLRIVPSSETADLLPDRSRGEFALGFSVPSGDGGFGFIASIFFPRVIELARQNQHHKAAKPAIILGYALAHEMGHLLLDTTGHSSGGIMQAPWGLEQLQLAFMGWLDFTPRQAERIRAQVHARMSAAQGRGRRLSCPSFSTIP